MKRIPTLALAGLIGLAACSAALAHNATHPPATAAAQPAIAPIPDKPGGGTRDARTYFTDLELQTQDGRKVRFYSDMLEGRTVLINIIYTNCKDACPLITRQMLEVSRQLGAQFGKEVQFVTLTSDPKRDSPAALKAYAVKQSADLPGWTYLTGSKENIEHILKKLGQFSQNVEEHSTILIAGNVPAKRWSKIRPDAPPLAIAERLKLLAAEGSSAGDKPKEP